MMIIVERVGNYLQHIQVSRFCWCLKSVSRARPFRIPTLPHRTHSEIQVAEASCIVTATQTCGAMRLIGVWNIGIIQST